MLSIRSTAAALLAVVLSAGVAFAQSGEASQPDKPAPASTVPAAAVPAAGIPAEVPPAEVSRPAPLSRNERNRPTWGTTLPAVDVERVTGWEWMPEGKILPDRFADLRHPRNVFRVISPGGHGTQLDVGLGVQFDLFRFTPEAQDAGWRFGVQVFSAAYMRFDMENETDVLGWDGYWGLPLVLEMGNFAAKLEFGHVSSHLGDETHDSSGIEPINYLKEEALFGVAWRLPAWGLRTYFESGYALRRGHRSGYKKQEWWRLQAGIDFVPDAAMEQWCPFIIGFNAESRQEVGWNIDTTLHIGYLLWRGAYDTNLRFAFEWHHGRSYVMQFHKKRVNWFSFGFTGDF